MLKDDIVDTPHNSKLLFQTRYIPMFEKMAREASKRGILVMIACHRIKGDAWPGKGMWYDESLGFSEEVVKQSWSKLAKALCPHWNVIAADLQNEPHSSSWAKDPNTDWNLGAARIGNHVLSQCPRWLIMVEGVGYTPGAPGADDPGAGFWWGENLAGATIAPVALRDQSKLVYSPHVYGPSVYLQHYFESPLFPRNMPGVWESHFASVQKETNTPIVIGEIGGQYTDQDRQWQDWAIPYCVQRGFGLFYFALNPDSEDTGGLVKKNWVEPGEGDVETAKLKALEGLASTNVFSMCPACIPDDAILDFATSPPPHPAHHQRSPPPLRDSGRPTREDQPALDPSPVVEPSQPQPQPQPQPQRTASPASTAAGGNVDVTNVILLLIIMCGAARYVVDKYPWLLVYLSQLLNAIRRKEQTDDSKSKEEEMLRGDGEAATPHGTKAHDKARHDVKPKRGKLVGRTQPTSVDHANKDDLGRLMASDDEDDSEMLQEPLAEIALSTPTGAALAPPVPLALHGPPQPVSTPEVTPLAQARETPASWLGARVRVHGLTGAPQHNGKEATVMSEGRGDPSTVRWNLRCDDGERLCLKESNLVRLSKEEEHCDAPLFLLAGTDAEETRSEFLPSATVVEAAIHFPVPSAGLFQGARPSSRPPPSGIQTI